MQESNDRIGDFDLSFPYSTGFQNVPKEMRALRNWVGWRFKAKGDGKQSKVPCSALTGAPAGTTDKWSTSWSTFEDALEGAERLGLDGVGFVFTEGCGYVGVDIDGAFSTPERSAITESSVSDLDSYTEISPSGEGLHVILAGELPPGASFCHSGTEAGSGFEVYDRGRYFTFTGLVYKGRSSIRCSMPALRRLVEREKGFWPGQQQSPDQEIPQSPGVPKLVSSDSLPPIPTEWLRYFERGPKHEGGDSDVVWINIAEDLFRKNWSASQVLTVLCRPGPINETLYQKRGSGSVQGAINWMWKYIVSKAERNICGAERETMSMFAPVMIPDGARPAPTHERERTSPVRQATATVATDEGEGTIELLDPPDISHLKVPPREWVMADFIPRGEVVAIYGDGGVGKSFLTLQLCAAIVTRTTFLGRALDVQGPVMAFYCEDDTHEVRRRLHQIGSIEAPTKTSEEYENSLKGFLFQSRRSLPSELATFDTGGKAKKTEFFHELRDKIEEVKPAVLILDSLYNFFVGQMNDSAQVRQFITYLCELADLGTTVILVSHPSQSGKNSGEGTAGSVAWSNGVRSRLYLSQHDDDQKGVLRLARMKGNYAGTDAESVIKLVKKAGVFCTWGGEPTQPPAEEDQFLLEICDLIDKARSMIELHQIPRADKRATDWLVEHTVNETGRYRGKKRDAGLKRYAEAMAHAQKTEELVLVPYHDGKQPRIAIVPNGMEHLIPGRVEKLDTEDPGST